MRQPFAHEAVVELEGDGDIRSPGAAITAFVCGSWDHDGPCPLAPHHTSARAESARVELRVLFATDPAGEQEVRRLIEMALASGRVPGEDSSRWRLLSHRPSAVRIDEQEQAAGLATEC